MNTTRRQLQMFAEIVEVRTTRDHVHDAGVFIRLPQTKRGPV
jgi:hypothetical protein